MHIFIKNNNLFLKHYKIKCAIGKRGIKNKKKEGDKITPKGKFKILSIYYRKDRVKDLKSKIRVKEIKKIWDGDDPRSKNYNKLVKFPFKYNAEKLYKKDNTYDIVLVLNYNINPTTKGKGSAIFIHVARKTTKRLLDV